VTVVPELRADAESFPFRSMKMSRALFTRMSEIVGSRKQRLDRTQAR
jgi:hypothetical protein